MTELRVVTDTHTITATPIGPGPHRLYHVIIYNTDDSLTQGRWSEFQKDVKTIICSEETAVISGVWYTSPMLAYQSMCIGFYLSGDFPEMTVRVIKGCLKGLAQEYGGCSIQWTEAVEDYIID